MLVHKKRIGSVSMLEREPLRTVARREIEGRILEGLLLPGDQLKLADLARTTGIGMTPLREAMIEVVEDGLLENHPGRGFFVPLLTVEEAGQLYPLIWTLEGLAVRLTGQFTESHVAELRRINEHFSRAEANPARALELDSEWHSTLVEKCENAVLLETLGGIKRRAGRYQFAFQRSAEHWPISVGQHDEIVLALESADNPLAVALLEENWAPGPKFVAEWLSAETGEESGGPQRISILTAREG